jgi:hypothetical protein
MLLLFVVDTGDCTASLTSASLRVTYCQRQSQHRKLPNDSTNHCALCNYNNCILLLLQQVTAQHASLRLGTALRAEGLGPIAGAPSATVVTACTAALQRATEVTALLPAACRRSEWIGGATAHPATFAGSCTTPLLHITLHYTTYLALQRLRSSLWAYSNSAFSWLIAMRYCNCLYACARTTCSWSMLHSIPPCC